MSFPKEASATSRDPKGNTETSILYIPGHLRGILRESLGRAGVGSDWQVSHGRSISSRDHRSDDSKRFWGARCCMFFLLLHLKGFQGQF